MRTTNNKLTQNQATSIVQITEEKSEAVNPETKEKVSIDFSKDLFSLLDNLNPTKVIKPFFQLDSEIADGYVRHKFKDYTKVNTHYQAIRRFLQEFSHTRLYNHLQSLNNPEHALQILLDMFSPPPPKPPQGQKPQQQNQQGDNKQDQQGNGQNQQGEGEGENQKQEEGKGEGEEKMDNSPEEELSDNPKDLPIDLEKFKNDMPQIEKILGNNIFNDDITREALEKKAGVGHGELKTIQGLAEHLKRISDGITERDFKIFDVARNIDKIEKYSREEEKSDVMYPEKDYRITNIKNIGDIGKIIPHQFLYPDKMFDKMLMDKDLKMKQYQDRKKKKQVLYILIDGSGSMMGIREVVTNGIAIAYIKKAIKEGSIYFYRHFDSSVSPLRKVTNKKEAKKEIEYLLKCPMTGGGTSIDNAIRHAIDDINNPDLFKQDNIKIDKNTALYDRADILVITDGEDTVNITKETLKKNNIVLHSFLLSNDNPALKRISMVYQKLNAKDMKKLSKN